MAELDEKQRDDLPARDFAFTKQRKMPIHDADHVRNAIVRFDQVEDVTDEDRDAAWKRIRDAAGRFGVDLSQDDWRKLGKRREGRDPRPT